MELSEISGEKLLDKLLVFDGIIEYNHSKYLSNFNYANYSDDQIISILKINFNKYLLYVEYIKNNQRNSYFIIKLIESNNLNKIFKMKIIKKLYKLAKEVQLMIFKIIRKLNCCPQIFCFNWIPAGSYYAPGLYNSVNQAMNNLEQCIKGKCSESFSDCFRNPINIMKDKIIDYYEPNEQYLKNIKLNRKYFT